MNNFNYTSVPGDLLYCDRRHLDDFDVDNSESLNYLIEKEFDRMFGTCPDYEDFAKNAFNTVYYVCTLALADSHPQRRFGAYLSIVDRLMHGKNDEVGVVLSIILIHINIHYWRDTKPEMDNLALKINSEIEKKYATIYNGFYQQIMNKYQNQAPYTTVPPNSEFRPREISLGVLRDSFRHWDWKNYFGTDMEMMLEFIFAIGKNEDEQNIIASFLQEQTHSSFTNGADHNFCFEYIERQIYLKYHAEEEKAQINAEIEEDLMKEYEKQWELDYYKDEFPKLKAENAALHAEIEQIKKEINNRHSITLEQFNAIFYPEGDNTINDKEQIIKNDNHSADENLLEIESLNLQLAEEKANNARLKEEMAVLCGPVKELNPTQNVRLAFALQLFRAAGLKDEKLDPRNRQLIKVATLMMLLLDIRSGKKDNAAHTCAKWLSHREYVTGKNKELIIEINKLFAELDWELALSLENPK